MASPASGTVTANTIELSWVQLTSDSDMGRDVIINYLLEYDSNSGSGY